MLVYMKAVYDIGRFGSVSDLSQKVIVFLKKFQLEKFV